MEDRGKKRIQWHPGFVTGINLELGGYESGIVQEREYNLNTKPLAIDVLLWKKPGRKKTGAEIPDNEIARIFRRYNIVEYKSELICVSFESIWVQRGSNKRDRHYDIVCSACEA